MHGDDCVVRYRNATKSNATDDVILLYNMCKNFARAAPTWRLCRGVPT
jgi:hypothetical protein